MNTLGEGRFAPFIVTAVMNSPLIVDPVFGITLDGLVASHVVNSSGVSKTEDVQLPFLKCEFGEGEEIGEGSLGWHWCASTSELVKVEDFLSETKTFSFFDETRCRIVSVKEPPSISSSQGRFRARRNFMMGVFAEKVVWHAVGNPEDVFMRLEGLYNIGGRKSIGFGEVLEWRLEKANVSPGEELQWVHSSLFHHRRVSRPLPQGCVEKHGLEVTQTVRGGVRPPVFHERTAATLAY